MAGGHPGSSDEVVREENLKDTWQAPVQEHVLSGCYFLIKMTAYKPFQIKLYPHCVGPVLSGILFCPELCALGGMS